MAKIKPHKRVNDILLGPLERPALQWLAAHMPAWMNPDILTGIGILGSLLIFASYCLSNTNTLFFWLASVGLVINWFGDSLDGTLARYRKIERPIYGYFVDHTVDAFSELFVILGLGLSPYIRFDIACLALIGYLLMSVLVYISTYVKGEFKISYGKFGPTEVRVVLIIINTIMYFAGPLKIDASWAVGATVYDLMVGLIALILFIIFIVSTIKQAVELNKLEQGKKA